MYRIPYGPVAYIAEIKLGTRYKNIIETLLQKGQIFTNGLSQESLDPIAENSLTYFVTDRNACPDGVLRFRFRPYQYNRLRVVGCAVRIDVFELIIFV
jgi:hypothetical protein